VYGPPGIRAYWAGFQAAMAMDIHLRVVDDGRVPLTDLVEVIEVEAGDVPFEGLEVSAYRTTHPPVEHSFAYRFEGSRTVVFSGDTVFDPGLGDFASGADVLVHEALLPEGIEAILARTGGGEKLRAHLAGSHTMIDDVGKVAALAGVGKLVLNHLVPVDDPTFSDAMWQGRAGVAYAGPVIVARDGMEIAL
ncbi:MAG: MBL fold metallo-hydrolase, partial [Tabrizicola sp.]